MVRHRSLVSRLAPLGLLALFGVSHAQTSFVYGLTDKGRVSVNASLLDKLPGSFDDDPFKNPHKRWWDVEVEGSDRMVLRRDGKVSRNGKTLAYLPYFKSAVLAGEWEDLATTPSAWFALRRDGYLTADGDLLIDYTADVHPFLALAAREGFGVWALRSDGAVLANASDVPQFQFDGGAGPDGAPESTDSDTWWFDLELDPEPPGDFVPWQLFALRRDGVIYRGVTDSPPTENDAGSLVAKLPTSNPPTDATSYWALDVLPGGNWLALRGDGKVYAPGNELTPLIDLPGDGIDADQTFLDIRFVESPDPGAIQFRALRWDGRIYDETGTELVNLYGDRYRRLAISDDPPDLTSFKNPKPVASKYKACAVDGGAISVPLIVADVETEAEDLLVTGPSVEQLATMPGASWDADERTLDWDPVGPSGKKKYKLTVDDQVNKPRVYTYTIKVKSPDENPLKNTKPMVAGLSTVLALVGHEVSFPILAADRDPEDTLVYSVNADTLPAGAAFDPETATFSWTPTFDDLGKTKVTFHVSDGVKTKSRKVKLKVVSPLIFDPVDEAP